MEREGGAAYTKETRETHIKRLKTRQNPMLDVLNTL